MTAPVPRRSLIERAAEIYDFEAVLRARAATSATELEQAPAPTITPQPGIPRFAGPVPSRAAAPIDRDRLVEQQLLVPGAPIGALAEEFRLVKRHLLQTARRLAAADAAKARTILVCSANPHEGKTFAAINLALSLAAERDHNVLLVDADFAKADVLARLGVADGPGLLDALADPALDVERMVIPTDVPQLGLLPTGTRSNSDTELVASRRTADVMSRLLAIDPNRIIVIDSPPVLAASPAGVLAPLVGQVLMVVRADRTTDGDLREAVALLDGCDQIQLLLNDVSFAANGPRYGGYYGQEDGQ